MLYLFVPLFHAFVFRSQYKRLTILVTHILLYSQAWFFYFCRNFLCVKYGKVQKKKYKIDKKKTQTRYFARKTQTHTLNFKRIFSTHINKDI